MSGRTKRCSSANHFWKPQSTGGRCRESRYTRHSPLSRHVRLGWDGRALSSGTRARLRAPLCLWPRAWCLCDARARVCQCAFPQYDSAPPAQPEPMPMLASTHAFSCPFVASGAWRSGYVSGKELQDSRATIFSVLSPIRLSKTGRKSQVSLAPWHSLFQVCTNSFCKIGGRCRATKVASAVFALRNCCKARFLNCVCLCHLALQQKLEKKRGSNQE